MLGYDCIVATALSLYGDQGHMVTSLLTMRFSRGDWHNSWMKQL